MHEHEKIDYIELPARDLAAARNFFTAVFAWSFVDYGPDYTAFSNAGVEGGFFRADLTVAAAKGSALIVFYSDNLDNTRDKIERSGGTVTRPVYVFPGGRRFHFEDPNGNEFAVWSDKGA